MKFKKSLALITLGVAITVNAYADGGFSLGATRLIYPDNRKDVTLSVYNTSNSDVYLIQSWLSKDVRGFDKNQDFLIVPPLFRLDAHSSNDIRVMYVGTGLPLDRESLFWLNVKAIPGTKQKLDNKNTLQLAFRNIIKVMYRPSDLNIGIEDAQKQLQFKIDKNLKITNPTPYYLTISEININGVRTGFENSKGLVPPYNNIEVPVKGLKHGSLTYSLINDYGGVTDVTTKL